MTVAIILYAKSKKIHLRITKPSMWKFLILIGLCETIAYLAITIGYSTTSETSVVALLSGAFSLPTIILARTFLKEKVSALQTIGAVFIIIGIILLALL
jgi:drug/metabolite transporter (DMT)-like permease